MNQPVQPRSRSVAVEPSGHPCTGLDWVSQIARHAFMQPNKMALRYRGESITYRDLDERTRRLATGLDKLGIEAGDRVIVLLTNRPEFVESIVAVNRLGAVAVPINFRLAPREVAYLMEDSGSKAIIVEQALAPLTAQARESIDGDLIPVVVGDDVDAAGPGGTSYDDLMANDPHPAHGPASEKDLALIMYTSGTTGLPKGAMLTFQNLVAQTIAGLTTVAFSSDDITLAVPPLFHIAGIGGVLPSLIVGNSTVILPTGAFDPAEFLQTLEDEQITRTFLVPTQWQAVCAQPGIAERDLKLRSIAWGASPASPAILRAMAEQFPDAPTICSFGQTEMSPVTTILRGEDAVRKLGSVGKPIPTVAIRIVDPAMQDVAPGEVGEIVYRGPGTMVGYWNKPEATEAAFAGGWFHSGDLVRQDEDGFIYVVDRAKDMIISGGENIYSSEVEHVIAEHPGVLEVALVGAPHPKWIETPVAFVVPKDPTTAPTEQDIIDFCRDNLASYKKPTQVHIVEELPRNASGKILKPPLREIAKEQAPG